MTLHVRHKSREWAVQLLYQLDIADSSPSDELLADFWAQAAETASEIKPRDWRRMQKLTDDLVRGVIGRRDELDACLARCMQHWTIERLAATDRSILRLATYELMFTQELPAAVCIDEAIELAKAYSGEESGSFVNGVLDQICHQERVSER